MLFKKKTKQNTNTKQTTENNNTPTKLTLKLEIQAHRHSDNSKLYQNTIQETYNTPAELLDGIAHLGYKLYKTTTTHANTQPQYTQHRDNHKQFNKIQESWHLNITLPPMPQLTQSGGMATRINNFEDILTYTMHFRQSFMSEITNTYIKYGNLGPELNKYMKDIEKGIYGRNKLEYTRNNAPKDATEFLTQGPMSLDVAELNEKLNNPNRLNYVLTGK